ncbi:hypothetical protein C0Q70_08070 [Pomacea canaliculata]|uniref:Uncharacterized protein n=1 Tax=Pomacea canaliculata TaxID=400727 RepID=A0A2T7PGU8_POMCA|nr:hypothetical protein C0Q70_08070 [Pomacea canaliculata]
MLEVCSAIDSDEDRDVVAEVDYTEGRTSEDEVPPQVCKKTAKKSHMTMEPVIRRTTAFNVFCSERLKANPNTGFQPEEWGFEWRTLTDASKKEYEAKAYALRRKNIDVRAILRNINNMTNLLKKNEEEAKSSEIEGVCTIVYKNNVLHFTEFGNLTGVKDPASEVVQTTLGQDMYSKGFCKTTAGIREKKEKNRYSKGFCKAAAGIRGDEAKNRTLWTAAEVLLVQQHFSEELAGLKPVTRSSIDSFLEQQTVVKRTSTALGNYLLRNRKKSRPDDQ